MLGVDVDQLRSQFAQQRKGNGSVVDERAALAGRGDLARECRFAAVIQVVSVEECLQVPCSEIENAFDQAITFVVFQGGVVVLVPQQEAQRAEQDRLPAPVSPVMMFSRSSSSSSSRSIRA